MKTSMAFLASWDQYMYIGTIVCIALAVLILLYHEFRIFQIKDYKDKHDYVNLHEIRYFWYAVIALIFAAACFFNTIGTGWIQEAGMRWFVIRSFIIVSFVVIAYFLFFSMVRVYYPKQLAKRLGKLRNTPRLSLAGNRMRKLSESEEDHHLEASQIEEEKMQVVDYDVWVDEKTGFKKIEKYAINQRAEECPECGYYTLKIKSEEVGKAPTISEEGYLVEHYQCSYCHHREQREMVVSKLSTNVA